MSAEIYYDMPVSADTPAGTLVKPSEYAIRPTRSYWLNCGSNPQKSRAKDALDKLISQRGTITENRERHCDVSWQDGTKSTLLHHMIITAKPE